MESKEFISLSRALQITQGELAMSITVIKALFSAVDESTRGAALAIAAQGREVAVAKSLGSAVATEAYIQGVENAARRFGLPG